MLTFRIPEPPISRRLAAFGLAGILLGNAGVRAHAQVPDLSARLTVRPREMATATRSPAAGEYALDSVPGTLVSVPPQCAGAHRCPLLLQLPGSEIPAREMTDWLRPATDKYGLILLAPTRYQTHLIDLALKEVLRRFAVDPEKIAIIGRCASGAAAIDMGINNLHVFSRIGSVSRTDPFPDGLDPENKTVEFFADAGYLESKDEFSTVRALREGGHPVKQFLALRGHEHQAEDYDVLARWLQESWTRPAPPVGRAPATGIADSLPELTTEALDKIIAFWTNFATLPDSIRTVARRAHQREFLVPVGQMLPSVMMMDMVALAKQYPEVANLLARTGLTAEQHDAYRVALVSAQVGSNVGDAAGTVASTSIMARNIAFMAAHQDKFDALWGAGVAHPDKVAGLFAIEHPRVTEALGPLGIWHTP